MDHLKLKRANVMTATDADLAALKEAYRIWQETRGGRVDRWFELMGDKFRYGSLDGGAPGVEFTKGGTKRDEFAAYLQGLVGDWEMLNYQVYDFVRQRDRVVALCRTAWRNRRTGKALDNPVAHIWRFEDGKAVELFEFCDTAQWAWAVRRDRP
jgi:hypothetical protein